MKGVALLRRVCLAGLICAAFVAPAGAGVGSSAAPPWSPSPEGLNFTVQGVDNVPDLHGDVDNPDLVIFFAGNQYMVVHDLIERFRGANPRYGRVFAETLPPGILAQQLQSGALVIGNMRITLRPDIFTAGRGRIHAMQAKHGLFGATADYARNRLAIMTRDGNPKRIAGLTDLGRKDVTLCMPNPRWEGIARNAIVPALRRAGGEALVTRIYDDKRGAGTAYLTRVHHRETPLWIMAGRCDAGVVWYTEAYFHAHRPGHRTGMVTLPARVNPPVTYTAAVLRSAPHRKAAAAFLAFLRGHEARAIYRHYGFLPPPAGTGPQ